MKNLVSGISFVVAATFAATAFASVDVTDVKDLTYNTKHISAKDVKGVNLVLSQEVTKTDCNEISVQLDSAKVSGSGEGYYDKLILDASMFQTEIYCPRPAEKVVVRSKAVTVKSYTNEYLKGAVELTVIYPSAYTLEVSEVK